MKNLDLLTQYQLQCSLLAQKVNQLCNNFHPRFLEPQVGLSYTTWLPIVIAILLAIALIIVIIVLIRIRKKRGKEAKVGASTEFLQPNGTHEGKGQEFT